MSNPESKFLKDKKPKKSIFISFFNKILIGIILVITCLIMMKTNSSFKLFIEKNVYQDNLSFAYFNNLYNKYFGSILPTYKENTTPVFNEKLNYKSSNIYYDGYKLTTNNSYLVPVIETGLVVFSGETDNYGNTIIIEGIDGVSIWYGNINNSSLKLYDYVTKGTYLGEINDFFYLVFQKDKEYLKIGDYLKN